MKRYLSVFVLLVGGAAARGAYFDYYAGGFYAFGEVYTADATDSNGPHSDAEDSTSYSSVEQYTDISNAYSYVYAAVWDNNDRENHSLCIRINSYADVWAWADDCSTYGYDYGSTEDPGTYGVYYRILPDAGEQTGDDVVVFCTTAIKVAASGDTYTYIGGPGNMSHMAITNGQLPPVPDEPESWHEVWTLDNLELTNDSFDGYTNTKTFAAKIGDVIGIFAENYTDITGQGQLNGWVESDLTIILTAKTVLFGDIDDDGDVDLYDLAILAKNWLQGSSG